MAGDLATTYQAPEPRTFGGWLPNDNDEPDDDVRDLDLDRAQHERLDRFEVALDGVEIAALELVDVVNAHLSRSSRLAARPQGLCCEP
jgi:hypothetical protein